MLGKLPVLAGVGNDGRNGGVFEVRRGGEALGEVDGVASLSELGQFLNGRRWYLLCCT